MGDVKTVPRVENTFVRQAGMLLSKQIGETRITGRQGHKTLQLNLNVGSICLCAITYFRMYKTGR